MDRFIIVNNGRLEVRSEVFEGDEVVTKLVKKIAVLSEPGQTLTICLGEDGYYYLLASDGFTTTVAGRYERFEIFDEKEGREEVLLKLW